MATPPDSHARESAPLEIRLHYDSASSLCCVAHRVLPRIQDEFDALEIQLRWSPLDLATLLGWRRGAKVDEVRRQNAQRVAEDLRVELCVPEHWLDSRRVMAAALCLERDPAREFSWRERVWTAIFDERRDPGASGELERLSRDLGVGLSEAALEAGLEELDKRTRAAADAQVTGVPTFMLDKWPFGGIQEEQTMRSILRRYARKKRGKGGERRPLGAGS